LIGSKALASAKLTRLLSCGLNAAKLRGLSPLNASALSNGNLIQTSLLRSTSLLNAGHFLLHDCIHAGVFCSLSPLNATHFGCLASLNASQVLVLGRLNTRCLCGSLISGASKLSGLCLLTRSQLCKARLINARLFSRLTSLNSSKLTSLCTLCLHASSTIKAELLSRLFKRSLRAASLNVTHLATKSFLGKRLLYSLTRTTECPGLDGLSCA
jgi:hypothetical protein